MHDYFTTPFSNSFHNYDDEGDDEKEDSYNNNTKKSNNRTNSPERYSGLEIHDGSDAFIGGNKANNKNKNKKNLTVMTNSNGVENHGYDHKKGNITSILKSGRNTFRDDEQYYSDDNNSTFENNSRNSSRYDSPPKSRSHYTERSSPNRGNSSNDYQNNVTMRNWDNDSDDDFFADTKYTRGSPYINTSLAYVNEASARSRAVSVTSDDGYASNTSGGIAILSPNSRKNKDKRVAFNFDL